MARHRRRDLARAPRERDQGGSKTIAGYAGPELLDSPDQEQRDALLNRIAAEMTSALVGVGDHYRAPDDVCYSLIDEPALDPLSGGDRLSAVSSRTSEPIVEEVLGFEDLPPGSP